MQIYNILLHTGHKHFSSIGVALPSVQHHEPSGQETEKENNLMMLTSKKNADTIFITYALSVTTHD